MRTLIIEFSHMGHYPEYVKHVLNQIDKNKKYLDYLIYLTPYLKNQIDSFKDLPVYASIHFFDEQTVELYYKTKKSKYLANFILNQIVKINSKYTISHVLFLNLNLVLRSNLILNPFKELPFTYSGIFFQSPYRLRFIKRFSISRLKREWILRLLSINKNCTGIFMLNDEKGAKFYSRWSDKIKFIPDPVNNAPPSDLNIYNYHNLNSDLLIFLHIGALGKYKGTNEIISEIERINLKLKEKIHFLFIGKMDPEVEGSIHKLNNKYTTPIVSFRNEFISDGDFSAYINQSEIVLIANKNVESSSGIINHCLSNNKVIIAPNIGYYKETLCEYKGALLFDEKFDLGEAIKNAACNYISLKTKASKFDSKSYVDKFSSNNFVKILLK